MNTEHSGLSSAQNSASGKPRRRKKKQAKTWVLALQTLLVAGVAIVLILGVMYIFRRKETITTTGTRTASTYAMVCETAAPKDPLFVVEEGVKEANHKIKVMYADGAAGKISYEYIAEMESEKATTDAEAQTHADYNIYMGQNTSDFSASFMPYGANYRITVTADDVNKLNAKTAKVFFLDGDEFAKLKNNGYQIEGVKRLIQAAGFRCEMDEKE